MYTPNQCEIVDKEEFISFLESQFTNTSKNVSNEYIVAVIKLLKEELTTLYEKENV